MMNGAQDSPGQLRQRIGTFIGEQVLAMRVDSRADPIDAAAIGFGWGSQGHCTIYRRWDTSEKFALSDEINPGRSSLGGGRQQIPESDLPPGQHLPCTVPHATFGQVHWLPEALVDAPGAVPV
jgi:hypothetical protein